ncbi:sensor histidine kinase [Kutzneria kofuensis]|uniref:Anti-sigma regulatory factor (Ser/Thr protein kinase) n=1 Tax=Kutzneria kofuensis TaxID=103725 RepID=A0A7W9KCT1_9PSEU|nr:sensor histidine kinase [Kutzneria kofuensis]MBB5890095.1 anti-sigma regulatory factor (Ser/Thr protein kinase) [Kutzneria kofuensis]
MVFRHEAFSYDSEDGFVTRVTDVVRAGFAEDAAVLIAVPAKRLEPVRDALGPDGRGVDFVDMLEVGRNPARMFPMWREFLDRNEGRPCRGVAEAVHEDRRAPALAECHQHETLLNQQFAATDWLLLCPYAATHPEPVLARARANHPWWADEPNPGFDDRDDGSTLAQELPEPFGATTFLRFDLDSVTGVREHAAGKARRFGLDNDAVERFTLAVHEVMVNSVDHGGGGGMLRLWAEDGDLVCEVRDEGVITDPLVGRRRPTLAQPRGRGMWMVNQLCDLVQVRSSPSIGTVVRLRITGAGTPTV